MRRMTRAGMRGMACARKHAITCKGGGRPLDEELTADIRGRDLISGLPRTIQVGGAYRVPLRIAVVDPGKADRTDGANRPGGSAWPKLRSDRRTTSARNVLVTPGATCQTPFRG